MLGITATFVVKAEQVLLSRRTPSYPRCQTEEHYLGSVSYSFGARSGGFDGEIPGSLGRLEAWTSWKSPRYHAATNDVFSGTAVDNRGGRTHHPLILRNMWFVYVGGSTQYMFHRYPLFHIRRTREGTAPPLGTILPRPRRRHHRQ